MAEPPISSQGGMPRWLKVSLIIVGALVLLVAILALTGLLPGQHGPGEFGPGRHGL